jgi:hypothetical protein
MARFASSSLVGPAMLALTSTTATRSSGARAADDSPPTSVGALTRTITAKPSCAASLGIDGYWQCIVMESNPLPAASAAGSPSLWTEAGGGVVWEQQHRAVKMFWP